MQAEPEMRRPFLGRDTELRPFRLQLVVVFTLATIAVFAGIFQFTRMEIYRGLEREGMSYFQLIVDVRTWNASHGGVWVVKTEDVGTNPYLIELGVNPDVEAVNGQTFTLRNPSAMTREIAGLTDKREGVVIHMTSDRPVNPANRPDPWEAAGITRLMNDAPSVSGVDPESRPRQYRYLRPLIVDSTCLPCHGTQGYEVGDVRGALSISIPMREADESLRNTAAVLALLCLASLVTGGSFLWLLVGRLERRVERANARLREAAVTDGLTGIYNRRAIMARLAEECERAKRRQTPLSLIMLDIDHFKAINDMFGHAEGDLALKAFVRRVSDCIRPYDVFGRIGGEEFVILSPETGIGDAETLAARILERMRAEPLDAGGSRIVTASAGIAEYTGDESPDELMSKADSALYEAKAAGRDTYMTAGPA